VPERVYPGWQEDFQSHPQQAARVIRAMLGDVAAGLYRGWSAEHRVLVTPPGLGTTVLIMKEVVRRVCHDVRGWPYVVGRASSFRYSMTGGLNMVSCWRATVPEIRTSLGSGWMVEDHLRRKKSFAIPAVAGVHVQRERALDVPVTLSDPCWRTWCQQFHFQKFRRPRFDVLLCRQPCAGFIPADQTLLLVEIDDLKHFSPLRLRLLAAYAQHPLSSRIWFAEGRWQEIAANYKVPYLHGNNGVCDGMALKEPLGDVWRDLVAASRELRLLRLFAPAVTPHDLQELFQEALTGTVIQRPCLLMAINVLVKKSESSQGKSESSLDRERLMV
jgi:hypothetical protein